MDSACATLESPLDSSKHIIAQFLYSVQRLGAEGAGARYRHLLSGSLGSEREPCSRHYPNRMYAAFVRCYEWMAAFLFNQMK
jgi:hypothetical protein